MIWLYDYDICDETQQTQINTPTHIVPKVLYYDEISKILSMRK